jgi:molecular chaperone GrpE
MVMQAGYELGGRIVRPAMVAVTPKTGASTSEAPAAAADPAQAGEGANPYAQGGPGASGANVNAKA